MEIREIMSENVFTVPAETPVSEVAQALVKGRFGSAVVMQGAWLAGIFTERDALRVLAQGTDPTVSAVSEWMTRDPVSVGPDATVEEVTERMAAGGFRHVPVVDGNDVVGIVSLRDVMSTRIGRRR